MVGSQEPQPGRCGDRSSGPSALNSGEVKGTAHSPRLWKEWAQTLSVVWTLQGTLGRRDSAEQEPGWLGPARGEGLFLSIWTI